MSKWISLLLGLISSFSTIAQVIYGKEDCRYLLNAWIADLRRVNNATGDNISAISLDHFNEWFQLAAKDVSEARFDVFQLPSGDGAINTSIMKVLRSETIVNAATPKVFFSAWDQLSTEQKELANAMHFLFRVNKLEIAARSCNTANSCGPVWQAYENLLRRKLSPDNFYKFILDQVEYKKLTVIDLYEFYEAFYPNLSALTGLNAESVKTFDTDKYVTHFAPELLFALGRYHEYRVDQQKQTNPISIAPYEGDYGFDRYAIGYFRKVLAPHYKICIGILIRHIEKIRNESCAARPATEPGKLLFTPTSKAIEQKEEAGLQPAVPKIEKGKGRLLVVQKRSNGTYQSKEDHAIAFTAGADGRPVKYAFTIPLNTYTDVVPGTYFISTNYPTKDSLVTTVLEGNTKVIRFPEKGSLSSLLMDVQDGEKEVHSMRIELLRQSPVNSYKLDTFFVDLWPGERAPRELNPGLYRVGVRMPANYFPVFVYADDPIEIQKHFHSILTVTGFSRLAVTALSGSGTTLEKLRVDLFSKEKNTKTKEYAHYRTYNVNDDIVLGPRGYRVVFSYAFPVIREVDIQADDTKWLRIDEIGSIRISNGAATTQQIEVINNVTKEKIFIRNNAVIDVESGQSYTIKCPVAGTKKAQTYPDVKVEKGKLTTVNW